VLPLVQKALSVLRRCRMKKKILVVQITLFVVFAGGFGSMILFTDSYDQVFNRIVSVTCLSCLKLDPKTSSEFIFETANGKLHPDFVLDNLTKGPVFLAYRKDVCTYCDEMEPLLMDIFNISFEKEDVFSKTLDFNGNDITFIHVNRDHSSKALRDSLHVYDKDNINGVPMFTIVTINYDHDGIVKPYYSTLYSKLGLTNDEDIKDFLSEIIEDSITLYNDNIAGYIN